MIFWNLLCQTGLGRILHSLLLPLKVKHVFLWFLRDFSGINKLKWKQGVVFHKLSDDTTVLDFYNEFDSGKIDGKPSHVENQASDFFQKNKN